MLNDLNQVESYVKSYQHNGNYQITSNKGFLSVSNFFNWQFCILIKGSPFRFLNNLGGH